MFRCGRQAHSSQEEARSAVAGESCRRASRKFAKALSPAHSRDSLQCEHEARTCPGLWDLRLGWVGYSVIGEEVRSRPPFKKSVIKNTFSKFVFLEDDDVVYYHQIPIVHNDLMECG